MGIITVCKICERIFSADAPSQEICEDCLSEMGIPSEDEILPTQNIPRTSKGTGTPQIED